MNLVKLFEMQKVLDDHIMDEHPELKGQNNLDWKILALLVEIGECANEWRGFKKWSKNQKPKGIIHTTEGATTKNAVEYVCANDDCGERFDACDENLKDIFGDMVEDCPECKVGYLYAMRSKNQLLEEYVDCLHFVLTIGIELNFAENIFTLSGAKRYQSYQPLKMFSLVYSGIEKLKRTNFKFHWYDFLFDSFIGLGLSLGFTWEQIEAAYMDKNAINHERQDSGY